MGAGIILAVIVLLVAFARFGGGTEYQTDTESRADTEQQKEPATYAAKEPEELNKDLYMDADKDVEERVSALLSQMTLEEKIAQMIQPEQSAISYQEIAQYGIGSVLSGGGSAPASGNTAADWQKHIDNMKQAALQSRLSIPLLYGVDAVHGHNNVYGATIFPHNIGLGAANDTKLMERIGNAVAEEVRATGIQWTFAPTLANPRNELWGRTYEGFAEDTQTVASLGAAFIRGLQGDPSSDAYLSDSHVLATAKHYIGEGYTMNGTNQGNVKMDDAEFDKLLHEELLAPYQAAIDEGVRTVMVSFSSVNGLKTHEDRHLITDVLKGELGFTGLVVSDYNGVQQVSGKSYKDKIENGVNAGIDLFMEPNSWKEFMSALQELVEEGRVSIDRIDDAVSRILRVKFEAGLFEEEVGGSAEQSLMESFGSEEHRAIAREAVAKSLVLLKNSQIKGKTAMQALAESRNILVTGRKANDIGIQCGGWTISWQGSTGEITEGTTIYQGLQQAAGEGVTVDYAETAEDLAGHDALIAVIGELPYAESSGDRSISNLVLTGEDRRVLEKVQQIKAANPDIPVIAVMVTGRMLSVADYIDSFDALVMAWLPGTEGEGVADVLLGDQDFTGTLKYTWPWNPSDIADKFDVSEDKILFKYGSGLRKDGSSITAGGTTEINRTEPNDSDTEMTITGVDLESADYVIEAENYTESTGALEKGNANNIVFVRNWRAEDSSAKWEIFVPKAGNYRMHFKISSESAIDGLTVLISGENQSDTAELSVEATSDLNDYRNSDVDAAFDEGSYAIQLNASAGEGDFQLDCIEFEYLD